MQMSRFINTVLRSDPDSYSESEPDFSSRVKI